MEYSNRLLNKYKSKQREIEYLNNIPKKYKSEYKKKY